MRRALLTALLLTAGIAWSAGPPTDYRRILTADGGYRGTYTLTLTDYPAATSSSCSPAPTTLASFVIRVGSHVVCSRQTVASLISLPYCGLSTAGYAPAKTCIYDQGITSGGLPLTESAVATYGIEDGFLGWQSHKYLSPDIWVDITGQRTDSLGNPIYATTFAAQAAGSLSALDGTCTEFFPDGQAANLGCCTLVGQCPPPSLCSIGVCEPVCSQNNVDGNTIFCGTRPPPSGGADSYSPTCTETLECIDGVCGGNVPGRPTCATDGDCVFQRGSCGPAKRCNDGVAADATCTADADCDFGSCIGQAVTYLPGYPLLGNALPNRGTRWAFDVTLQAVVPAHADNGGLIRLDTGSCGLRCTDGPLGGSVCTTDSDCGQHTPDMPPGFYTCGRVCSNDLNVACTSDANCDFRIGLGTPVLEGDACDGIACGDGYIDGDLGEECDDGPRNGTTGSMCSCSCSVVTTTTTTTTSTSTTTTLPPCDERRPPPRDRSGRPIPGPPCQPPGRNPNRLD